ncbi:hypothetical protein ACFL6S_31125 [Candidatus Poribacteria bacterium]
MKAMVFLMIAGILLLTFCWARDGPQHGHLLFGSTGILPCFQSRHGDLKRFAFMMMILLFILGLGRIIFNRSRKKK